MAQFLRFAFGCAASLWAKETGLESPLSLLSRQETDLRFMVSDSLKADKEQLHQALAEGVGGGGGHLGCRRLPLF